MTNETFKILLVDDEELNLKLTSRLLSCDRYTLHTSGNGKDAIKLAQRLNPDLVLLDLLMPELDGAETCRILKNTAATSQIPIIMLTGHPDKDAKLQCLRAGANDFIAKPVDSVELQLRVKNLLEFRRHADTKGSNNLPGSLTVKKDVNAMTHLDRDSLFITIRPCTGSDTSPDDLDAASGIFIACFAGAVVWALILLLAFI